MKKITALLLALVLALSLCTAGAAADETVTIVLEPADDTLLTAEGLALFFVDRAAIEEETETAVSWYKETTANGKTERELIEEMPLVIKPGVGRAPTRVYVADGYEPTQELIDLVAKYAPEKKLNTDHIYGMHRVLGQSCMETGLRYGTCWHCFGIEFDLAGGPHIREDGVCTVCGQKEEIADPTEEPEKPEEPEHTHTFGPWIPLDDGENHGHECTECGYFEMDAHDMETERIQYSNKVVIIERCTVCGLEYRSEMA